MYCFDTDVLSAALRREPPLGLLRRLAEVPPNRQFTTAITAAELIYGAAKLSSARLLDQVRSILREAQVVLPFDHGAAEVYGQLRCELEDRGQPLAEPDLRIASIAVHRDLTLITGNERHFARVPGLRLENWIRP